ncbi:MAG: hypothetical protein ABI877_01505 [Gemmatimonadaceae bacterium]
MPRSRASRTMLGDVLAAVEADGGAFVVGGGAIATRHKVLPEHYQHTCGHRAGQWFGDVHNPDIRVDGPIEREFIGEGVDEEQGVLDVSFNECLFGTRLGKAEPAFRRLIQLPGEERLGKERAQK